MITSLYASLLALIYFKLSLDTIKARKKHKISLGYGPNNEIEQIVSAHGNFAAYVPLLLLLTLLAEISGMLPFYAIHLLALSYTVGRVLHYMAFGAEKMNFKLRVLGMHLTLWPLLILAATNALCFFLSVTGEGFPSQLVP